MGFKSQFSSWSAQPLPEPASCSSLTLHMTSSFLSCRSQLLSPFQRGLPWTAQIKGLPYLMFINSLFTALITSAITIFVRLFSSLLSVPSQKNKRRDHVVLLKALSLVQAIGELSCLWGDLFQSHLQSQLLAHEACLGGNWFPPPRCLHGASPVPALTSVTAPAMLSFSPCPLLC